MKLLPPFACFVGKGCSSSLTYDVSPRVLVILKCSHTTCWFLLHLPQTVLPPVVCYEYYCKSDEYSVVCRSCLRAPAMY